MFRDCRWRTLQPFVSVSSFSLNQTRTYFGRRIIKPWEVVRQLNQFFCQSGSRQLLQIRTGSPSKSRLIGLEQIPTGNPDRSRLICSPAPTRINFNPMLGRSQTTRIWEAFGKLLNSLLTGRDRYNNNNSAVSVYNHTIWPFIFLSWNKACAKHLSTIEKM